MAREKDPEHLGNSDQAQQRYTQAGECHPGFP